MHKKRLEPFATLFLYSFHNNIKKTPFTVFNVMFMIITLSIRYMLSKLVLVNC